MQRVLEGKPCKSSKIDQITQDQSYYEGNLTSKEPNMMIQFARITNPIFLGRFDALCSSNKASFLC
jgi:hypothetical protein